MTTPRDLILGVALGYKAEHLHSFVASLLRIEFKGVLVLFIEEESDLPDALSHKINTMYVKVRRNADDTSGQIVLKRYFFYQDFFRQFSAFDRCLITDVRDVIFQRDPFAFDGWDRFSFFYALEERVIGDCTMNSKWMVQRYGRGILRGMLGHVISCAGTVYGKREALVDYVDRMCDHLRDAPRLYGLDMATHNYIVYNEPISGQKAFLNGLSPVMTVHYMNYARVLSNKQGEFENYNGTVPNLVHQYDRLPEDLLKKFSVVLL